MIAELTYNNIFFWLILFMVGIFGISWLVELLSGRFYFKGKGLNKSVYIKKDREKK